MNFPEKLKKRDTVALVAPSSPTSREKVDLSEQFLRDMGYQVVVADSVYKTRHGYQSGPGKDRAEDINRVFADPQVKGVFCIGGGSTSSHVLPHIDIDVVRAHPKVFVGYSDVTNLHIYFQQEADLVTFHGPMVATNMIKDYDDFSRKAFEDVLFMDQEHTLENPPGVPFVCVRPGKAQGRLTGGNLALVTSMIGTPYEIDTKGKVLFLEDTNENISRVDRMLHQLKYSGKFDDALAVLIGDFKNCENQADKSYGLHELIADFFKDYDKPVIDNVQAGHCVPTSTLPLGMQCRVDADTLTITFLKR